MRGTINRLNSGIFLCVECLNEFEAIRIRENNLLCPSCKVKLIPSVHYENWCMLWMERFFKIMKKKSEDPPAWLVNLVIKYINQDYLKKAKINPNKNINIAGITK